MLEPSWIAIARNYIGLRETHGDGHTPAILQFWRAIRRSGIKDDETPWCAAFVGAMLEESGIVSTRYESAASYTTWGVELSGPQYGCIAVMTRKGGGHVGFVVGRRGDRLLVLGGNQGDEVSIRAFPRERITSYRWPPGIPCSDAPLPEGAGALSTRES